MTIRRPMYPLLALALALPLAATVACSGGSSATTPSQITAAGPTAATAVPADVTITIVGMNGANSFSPSPGAVAVGKTVSWMNADSVAHTATGSGFDTGLIQPGGTSAPIRFDTAGTFAYRCTVHPSMTGSLKVGDSGAQVNY